MFAARTIVAYNSAHILNDRMIHDFTRRMALKTRVALKFNIGRGEAEGRVRRGESSPRSFPVHRSQHGENVKSVTARDARSPRRLFGRLCVPAKQPRIACLARIFSLPSKTMQLASRKRCPFHGHSPSKYYPILRFYEQSRLFSLRRLTILTIDSNR